MSIPVLETERLILRGHTAEDFPAVRAMVSDPDVMRFLGGAPLSEEDAWARLLRVAGHWVLNGFGFWSVHDKATGERIGEAGWLAVKRIITPSLEGMPESGWAFTKAAQGKGYATEAVTAIHAWGENKFGKVRTCCIIAPENAPSLRLADRMGYRAIAETTYKNEPIVVLHREP